MPAVPRSTAQTFALELDGVSVGRPIAIEGGEPTSDVVVERLGTDQVVRKHLGGVRYEPIVVETGASMNFDLYDWLATTLERRFERKDGAIVAADFDGKERSRRTFHHALVTSIGF